jgi:DnaJ-class molecular chaperone
MNFYEQLGVAHDATEAEIKAAYRKQASVHHEDKGGDKATMQAINEAYAVLSDAAKRALYDEAGAMDPNSHEAKAQAHLDSVFREAIERGFDPIEHALATVGQSPRMLKGKLVGLQADREISARKLGRYRRKDGKQNRIELLLKQRLAAIDLAHRQASEALQIANLCVELLGQYEELQPAKPKTLVMQFADGVAQAQGRAFS